MNELAFVKRALVAIRRRDLPDVERGSGVPVDTLIKIKYGTTRNPRYNTVSKLMKFFRAKPRRECVGLSQ